MGITGLFFIGGPEPRQSWQALFIIKNNYLAVVAGLVLLLWLLDVCRMRTILHLLGERLSPKDIFQVNLAYSFAAAVTPAASGGPPAHAYFFYLKGIKGEKAVVCASARMLFGVGSIAILNPIVVFAFRENLGLPEIVGRLVLVGILIVSGGILGFLFFSFRPDLLSSGLGRVLPQKLFVKIKSSIHEFSNVFQSLYSSNWGLLTFVLFLSFFYWGIFFTIGWVLAKGLGSSVSWSLMVARQMVLHFLLGYVPLPGASGVSEISYAAFFKTIIPDSSLPDLVAGWRFFTYYLNILIGSLMFWWLLRKKPVFSD